MIRKEQRDVWLIRAPFSDYSAMKVRPVIIISNNPYNRKTPDFLAVHITTRTDHQYSLPVSAGDFVSGELADESIVRFDTISRYEEKLLLRKIGKIKPECHKKLYEKIVGLLNPGTVAGR
ncbi:type II toxin-antitoxin system PemK/MazF family toxin [Candidatus Micrarchaeota archaeon]|nr:type II toxin-antitoxin system PemK/MazF family toxin [Candidatus Micrarchaeota archaeon]